MVNLLSSSLGRSTMDAACRSAREPTGRFRGAPCPSRRLQPLRDAARASLTMLRVLRMSIFYPLDIATEYVVSMLTIFPRIPPVAIAVTEVAAGVKRVAVAVKRVAVAVKRVAAGVKRVAAE